jgi:hypothetical protein
VAVDDASNLFRKQDGGPLRFGRGVAEAVDQWQVGPRQELRRRVDCRGYRYRLSIDQRWMSAVVSMTMEPGAAQCTCAAGADNALAPRM